MSDHLDLREDEQALLEQVPAQLRAAHGIPDAVTAERRRQGHAAVQAVLGPDVRVEVSVLGPAWSSDVDVSGPLEAMADAAAAAGWIPLDPWLAAVGSGARNVYAVTGPDGRVLTSVDLVAQARHDAPRTPARPEAAVAERARRRGAVRLREVLELQRVGAEQTGDDAVDDAVRRLRRAPDQGPIELESAGPPWRQAAGGAKRALRPKAVVALCGVDGAGKSTTSRGLTEALTACGIDVGHVWARPGMNIGVLDRLARVVKRSRGDDLAPGVRKVADGAAVPSRQGVLGWAWSLLVVLAFAADVARQHRRARGVVIYDRHLPDAMATIDVLYGGGPKRLHRWLVHRALPTAALSVYLRIDADTAVARKPDDTIGPHAVRAQLDAYEALLAAVPRLVIVDATAPPIAIVAEILRAAPPTSLRTRVWQRLRGARRGGGA